VLSSPGPTSTSGEMMLTQTMNSLDTMDALVCISPGTLQIEQRPAPARGEGEVLVAVRRIGICGTDFHIFEGKHPFLQYPRVMGHELAVEVLEAPAGSGFSPGEICAVNPYLSCGTCIACRAGKPNCCVRIAVLGVHRDGGMASFLSLPPQNLVRAEGLSTDDCAAVEFLAIGAHAVRRSQLAPTDRALVVGAGPIGLGVAMFASVAGARVTVMDRDAERLKAAESLAGAEIIQVDGNPAEVVAERTGGEGFEAVFDATGNPDSMSTGFDFVAHGGRYVLVSVVKGPIAFEDADFHRKEMTLLGSRNATAVDFDKVIGAMRDGRIPVQSIITHRTTLSGAVRDMPVWATDKRGLIKAVIEMRT
jgi:2-desacetyl-2-hydroxyethyl bacteriochlorophyllide A dehydrogenase